MKLVISQIILEALIMAASGIKQIFIIRKIQEIK